MFKDWTWQKWAGKLAPLVAAGLVQVWAVIEQPVPVWAPIAAGLVTFIVQQLLALFPPKE